MTAPPLSSTTSPGHLYIVDCTLQPRSVLYLYLFWAINRPWSSPSDVIHPSIHPSSFSFVPNHENYHHQPIPIIVIHGYSQRFTNLDLMSDTILFLYFSNCTLEFSSKWPPTLVHRDPNRPRVFDAVVTTHSHEHYSTPISTPQPIKAINISLRGSVG